MQSNLKRDVIKGVQWSSLGSVFNALIEFGRLGILAHILSSNEFGLIAMVILFSSIGTMAVRGISLGIIPNSNNSRLGLNSLAWFNVIFGVLIFLIIYISAPLLKYIYEDTPQVVGILRLLSISILFSSFGNIYSVLMRKKLLIRELSIIKFLSGLISSAVAIIFALKGYEVKALIFGNISLALTESILNIVVGSKKLNWRHSIEFSWKELKQYLSFGLFRSADFVVLAFIENIDYLIIGKLFGSNTLGVYNVAYNISRKPNQKIIPIINTVAFPAFAKIKDDKNKLLASFIKGIRMLSFILSPLLFGLAGVSFLIIPLFLGNGWDEAIPVISVLSIYSLFVGIENPMKQITLAEGGGSKVLYWNLINLAGVIISIYIGSISDQIIGIAISLLIYKMIFVLVFCKLMIYKYIKISWKGFIKAILPPVFFGAITAIIEFVLCEYFYLNNISLLFASTFTVSVGMFLYFILSMIFLNKYWMELIQIFPQRVLNNSLMKKIVVYVNR